MHERPYEKLIVWKEAHILCLSIYTLSKKFPDSEKFGLVTQMRKSSYSVPTNIAEGNTRRTNKDKSHFFIIALGSLEELHYQCTLARDLEYITKEDFDKVDDHIQRTSFLLTKLKSAFQ
jgi:four helix bundle protein